MTVRFNFGKLHEGNHAPCGKSLLKSVWFGFSVLLAVGSTPRANGQGSLSPIAFYNQDVTLNYAAAANDYEITVRGNRLFTGYINGFRNGSYTSTYNSVPDTTTIRFQGDTISQHTTVHFGYSLQPGVTTQHGFGPPDALAQGFTYNGTTVESKISGVRLSLKPVGNITGNTHFLVGYAKVAEVGNPDNSIDEWFGMEIDKGQTPSLFLQNSGSTALDILDWRYSYQDTLTLDQLNMTGAPPSTLTPIIDAPFTLQPNSVVPEPSGVLLSGIGMLGLAGLLRMRSRLRK